MWIVSIIALYVSRETVYDEFGQAIKMAKERLKVPFPHEPSEHQFMFEHPIIDFDDYVEKEPEIMLTYSHLGLNKAKLYNGSEKD